LYPLHPPIFDQMDDHLILSNHSLLTSYLNSNLCFIISISILYSFLLSHWPHELMIYVTIFILVSIGTLNSPSHLPWQAHALLHVINPNPSKIEFK
jgi:hypothetical protein